MPQATEERRQHRRLKLENSISISSLGIFQVTDISRGGFGFRCPPYTPIPEAWETNILASTVSLNNFPAHRVWLSMIENDNHEYLPTSIGVKFGRLTKEQTALLQELLLLLERNSSSKQ